ncbi:maltose acetyltransferase [Pseudoalteromonas sp. 13-15]|uniref:sugar O-acetyltransferase n=1 Tax=Pseudoalteromonas TaxID=53246 RepID=UPI0007319B08|nr:MULTISPECIES: sugar O-acetyltransferase [Pseudoalteromonas]AUL74155.1 maltose acetyltransferase [Pseudoalteromonas sp. 13-15]WFO19138.1 sugar O-acetyltransferase [Pseudoalteromonas sp. H100]SIN98850.1 maltose O-acetyltransferase [Pseudoalteromonas marina]
MQSFNSLDKTLLALRKQTGEICRLFNKSPSKGNLKRIKELFAQCGEGVIIESGFHCDYGNQITIGDRSFININCTVLDAPISEGAISIGQDCLIGPNVQLLAVSHAVNPTQRLNKENFASPITVGNNVWIGAGVIVLAGVTIGDNAVVGAGSVVTKNVEADTLVAGNPALKIRIL